MSPDKITPTCHRSHDAPRKHGGADALQDLENFTCRLCKELLHLGQLKYLVLINSDQYGILELNDLRIMCNIATQGGSEALLQLIF